MNKYYILIFSIVLLTSFVFSTPPISFASPTPENNSEFMYLIEPVDVNISAPVVVGPSDVSINSPPLYGSSVFLDLNRSLIAWIRGDDNIGLTLLDNSTYDYNSKLNGTATINNSGKRGKALSFDGTADSNVQTDSNMPIDGNKTRTLSFWAKPDTNLGSQYLVGIGANAVNSRFAIRTTIGKWQLWLWGPSDMLGPDVNTSKWTLHTLTYDGQKIKWYIDGQIYSTQTIDLNTINSPLTMGHTKNIEDFVTVDYNYDGLVDDVMLWNRALDSNEVLALYNANTTPYYNRFRTLSVGPYSLRGYMQNEIGDYQSTEDINITITPLDFTTDDDDDGYLDISTCDQLQAINQIGLDKNYELVNDIDCSESASWNDGQGFTPIGNSYNGFSGNFNGNDYNISNLTIYRPGTNYVGLFGWVDIDDYSSLRITNINLVDANIWGYLDVGGIVGHSAMPIHFESIVTSGEIRGQSNVGGIVGYMGEDINVLYSQNSAHIYCNTSADSCGGIIGQTQYSKLYMASTFNYEDIICGGLIGAMQSDSNSLIISSINTGYIVADRNYVGGLVGYSNSGSDSIYDIVIDSENDGNVYTSQNYAGGIFGIVSNAALIRNSSNSGKIDDYNHAGGLVGSLGYGFIFASNNSQSISGQNHFGGLVGTARYVDINMSSNTGSISAYGYIGGLVGDLNIGSIENSYSDQGISGYHTMGGLAGRTYDVNILNSYSKATDGVLGYQQIGGLIGTNTSNVQINNSFFYGYTYGYHQYSAIYYSTSDSTPTLSNNWVYITSDPFNQINDTGSGDVDDDKIADASSDSFYNKDFNVYVGENPWDFNHIWYIHSDELPTLLVQTDTDLDGTSDYDDRLLYDKSYVQTNVSDLNILVDNDEAIGTFSGIKKFTFLDGNKRFMDFNFNFDQNIFDMNQLIIAKGNGYLLISLAGQLQQDYNKTLYMDNNGFNRLCVMDAEMNPVEVSANCNRENEYDFSQCLSAGNYTHNGIVCEADQNTIIISNIRHSGIIGTYVAPSQSSSGSSRRSRGGNVDINNTNPIVENESSKTTNLDANTSKVVTQAVSNDSNNYIAVTANSDNNEIVAPAKESNQSFVISLTVIILLIAGLIIYFVTNKKGQKYL